MKTAKLMTLTGWLRYGAAAIIVLMPFHGFLSVWAASGFGHYTLVRLWKEVLLMGLLIGCLIVLARRLNAWPRSWRALRDWSAGHVLETAIIAYLVLTAAAGAISLAAGQVSLKAFAYGALLDGRFLVFFLAVRFICQRDGWIAGHWRQLLLLPAAVVVAFGLLQFSVLPADFLKHFGYGPDTINAVQTIDQKAGYQRIQSTLRGANPLGAYLILILAAIAGLLLRARARRWHYVLYLAAACAALGMTFSRSAWIGTLAALAWLIWQSLHSHRVRRYLLVLAGTALVVFAAAGYGLRHNDTFQNTFFHTDEKSRSASSSNYGHLAAGRRGVSDLMRQPLGRGTGTAGPASVYNHGMPRIAENYYLQIGQETGFIGLALFVGIVILMARRLWARRSEVLAQVLLASLVGISLVGLLSHVWTDDTLSYIWWGLAGAALAVPPGAAAVATENTRWQ